MIPMALLLAGGAGAAAMALKVYSDSAAKRHEAAVPREGELIDVEGARLHVVDRGSGPAIVMIHGLGGQMRNFARGVVDDLARDYRVILVDRPGSGYSVRNPGVDACLSTQAASIASLIDKLGLERPLVVGHSLGGALALSVAVHHPDKVGGLALVAPLTQMQEEVPEPLKALAIRSDVMRRFVASFLAIPVGMATRDKVLVEIFGPDPVPEDFATAGGGSLALRPRNFYNASCDMVALEEELPKLVARYGEIRVPVTILYGKGDRILDPEVHGGRMKDIIPGLELELIEGGHMIPFTAPDATAAWIRRAAERGRGDAGGHSG